MTTILFSIEGVAAGALDPFEVVGTEAASNLYAYEVACDLNLDAPPGAGLVGSPATLVIEPTGASPRRVHGIIESFTAGSPLAPGRPPVCRFRLVPRLSLLAQRRQSQLYGTAGAVSVAEVIAAEMGGTLRQGNTSNTGTDEALPFDLRLQQAYPPLDHLAQYEETNLDFLSRLTERYGIYYFFEESGDGERVVFADSNVSAPFIDADGVLDWHAWTAGSPDVAPDTVQQLEARHGTVPSRVYLRDYNYRTPHVDLLVEQPVGTAGSGAWMETEDRFLTQAEGQFLARLRAEEMASHGLRLHGRSMVARLSAGHAFRLQGHPFDAWNRAYLVLSVQHTARVARPGLNAGPDQPMGYFNTFTVLPLDVPFRPARVTPRPKLAGLMNGVIEGSSTGTDPLLDDQGRYKVRLPFDLSNSPDGEGSRWIRLATPFGGEGDGMHFPLHPGTEVVVAHVNGDPDRPVILGAVSNPATPSLVNGQDPSHNRITFRSGMGFDASTGNAAGNLGSATVNASNVTPGDGNTVRVWVKEAPVGVSNPNAAPSPYQWLRLGASIPLDTGDGPTTKEGANALDGFDLATGGVGRIFAGQDLFLIRDGKADASAPPKKGAVAGAVLPASTANRLIGINDSTMNLAHDGVINIGEAKGANGYPTVVNVNARDNYNLTVDNVWASQITGNNLTWVGGANEAIVTGLNLGVVGGDNTSITGGVSATIVAGANFNVFGALVMNITAGFTVNFNAGPIVNMGSLKTSIATAETRLTTIETNIRNAEVALGTVDTRIGTAKTAITAATTLEIDAAKLDLTTAAVKMSEVETKIAQMETSINSGVETKLAVINTKIGNVDTTINSLMTNVSTTLYL